MTDSIAPGTRADVEVRLPADGVFVSVLRTTAAAIAARLDFTVDDIEDLRVCVSEAGALVIPVAAPGSDLLAHFVLGPGALRVELTIEQAPGEEPDLDSFAWQVLDAVAADAAVQADGEWVRVRFAISPDRTAEGGGTAG